MDTLLQVESLKKKYRHKTVVDDVSLRVNYGEIVGLLGPNGAGKTTSFYMIVGLIKSNQGKILFQGDDITALSMDKRAKKGISYLAQEPSIFRKLSVEDNIRAILQTMSYSRKQEQLELDKLLDQFKLQKVRKQDALTLSGGERRRLEIARSLVIKPKILMLDEPFSGVDPIAVEDVQSIILELKEQNLAVLITDHNAKETLNIIDRAYLLSEGKIIDSGNKHDLLNDKNRKIYFGENFSL